MPLSRLQGDILRLLAAHRSPDSYVAGATVLNRESPRFSNDIDIFHDVEERVAQASGMDTEFLVERGLAVQWLRREPGLYSAIVKRRDESTRLEWVRDSDFRFFPTVKDEEFGYRLHVVDVATNKALAASGRREPRDVLDLLYVHAHILPLGAVIWAAVGKDPGFSPESLILEIRRNARYLPADYADLKLTEPVDAGIVSQQLREALNEADLFVRVMPAGKEGLLFLMNGVPVQPDTQRLGDYIEHSGQRRGYWPSSSEIGSAMLYRSEGKPKAM